MNPVVIGIDTSAYTTSICATDVTNKSIVFEQRKILDVPIGDKGLRQSMAVFQHMKNLPCFIEELFSVIPKASICCIAITDRPRTMKDSYMPVFFAGHTYARVLSTALGVPIYTFSHQEGHIAAGIGTLKGTIKAKKFVAIHLSGGTSEICVVEHSKEGYSIDLIGGTMDLHAGQFVDRIGVKMGLGFPAGSQLEKIATESTQRVEIPSSVRGYNFSFSGPATKAERLLEQGNPQTDIARGVEHCIAKTIEKVIRKANDEYSVRDILVVGGVASNSYIREFLQQRFNNAPKKVKIHFAERNYSSDQAFGTSLLGIAKHSCNE